MTARAALSRLCLVAALCLSACSADERWEGLIDRCDGSNGTLQALITLTSPRTPSPTGMFGVADDDARDTWDLTDLEDSRSFGGAVKFTATFDYGPKVDVWTVDLKETGPGRMEGSAELESTVTAIIRVHSRTVCKMDVKRIH